MGVDGFRLDAVPYLVEEASCLMDCSGTHAFLREYAAHIDSISPGAYTVGEVWDSIGRILPYYPDQLTSYFAFDLADSLRTAVRRGVGGRAPRRLPPYQDTVPAYRWSPFLSNHDGTRSMTVLGGDLAKAKLAATLLLTLPGLPFIYYGEEIGMTGDKPDERLRTPMQWKPGAGTGFTTGTPWESAQPDSMTVTVEAQDADSGSLLNRTGGSSIYGGRTRRSRWDGWCRSRRAMPPSSAISGGPAIGWRSSWRTSARPRSGIAALGRGGAASRTVPAQSLLGGPDGVELEVRPDGAVRDYSPVRGALAPGAAVGLRAGPAAAPRPHRAAGYGRAALHPVREQVPGAVGGKAGELDPHDASPSVHQHARVTPAVGDHVIGALVWSSPRRPDRKAPSVRASRSIAA
jgi:hypothetical protein